ncbi:FG-GAP-like repeat-containing protein [Acidicapsa ligni]|uniref:FG-GAP-like repeat-containing protein n=1 Tax=Acidicapsa ligni TaxID=542300 RepID=UPI0021E05BAE|nr:FG-GAP-like repeat-containing protein [Acidicapsa ligni]
MHFRWSSAFSALIFLAVPASFQMAAAQTPTATPNFGGFYAAPVVSAGSTESATIVTGDFNKDGKPDLVTVNSSGQLEILLNNGSGGFETPSIIAAPKLSGINSYTLNAAIALDLNGDGYSDLVLGTSPNSSLHPALVVLLNQKNGSFGAPVTLSLPNPTGYPIDTYSYGLAQTTTSGHNDIVAVEWLNTDQILLQVLTNDGSGNFSPQTAQTINVPVAQQPYSSAHVMPAFADVNHDGKQDLLLEREDDRLLTDYVDVLLGNGNGTFQLPSPNTTVTFPSSNAGLVPYTVLTAQSLTTDASKADLILINYAGVYTALGNGDGTFQTPNLLLNKTQTPNQSLQTGCVLQVQAVDLNGDSKPDLVAVGCGALVTYLGNGDGTFNGITGTAVGFDDGGYGSVNLIVTADFNGDGKVDFANSDASGNVELGIGNGDGTFVATPLLYSANSPILPPQAVGVGAVADLNGDGFTDLIALGPNSLVTGLANAKGGFSYQTTLPYSTYGTVYVELSTGDFNGDGRQDIVLVGDDGTAAVALSNGDGTFRTPVNPITPSMALACALYYSAVGDINGDGKLDLVFAYPGDVGCGGSTVPSGYFTVLGNGDGTFKTPTFYASGTDLYTVTLASFHGKNNPLDLILGSSGLFTLSGSASILKGNGDGTFEAPTVVYTGNSVQQILTDDFNQDGSPDLTLVTLDSGTGGEAMLYAGNGDGTFKKSTGLGANTINNSAIYADVNGDGIPDLIGDDRYGLMFVNLGTGQGSFAPSINYFFSGITTPLFAGNFLGDNTQSIVGFSEYLGGTAFFMNQGGTSLTVTASPSPVAGGTSVVLTANLAATLSHQPEPIGTIKFYDNSSTLLGSSPVGTPFSFTGLQPGVHSITAVYSGDAHFNPNTSTPFTVTISAPPPPDPDFTFTSSAVTLTLAAGLSGTLNLTIADNASLTSKTTFQCSGLPAESSCSFTPSTLSVSAGNSGTTTLSISTKAASTNIRLKVGSQAHLAGLGVIAAGGLLFLILPRKRAGWFLLVAVVTLGSLIPLSGCGGGSSPSTPTGSSDPGTPTGTSNITVTATATSGSTTITHTATIALTVQ